MKTAFKRLRQLLLALLVAGSLFIVPAINPPHVALAASYTITIPTANPSGVVDTGTSLTFTPTMSWAAGDYVIVVYAGDTALSTNKIAALGTAGGDLTLTADATANNAGSVVSVIYSAKVITAGSNKTITLSNANNDVKAAVCYKITGLDASAFDKQKSSTGTSNAPSSTATSSTTQADEILIAGIGQEDDNDAAATGTWGDSVTGTTYQQKTGSDSGSTATDIVVQANVAVVTSTGTYTASKSGITSCDWGAEIATYKLAAAAPEVTTQAVSAIAATTATGNGTVVNRGIPSGSGLTERGVCYSTSSDPPTTADSTAHDHTDSTGAFTASMTGLTEGTHYHARAYAINATGTAYGSTVYFYTLPAAPTDLASPSQTSSSIDLSWTKGTGGDKTMVRQGGVVSEAKDYYTTGSDSAQSIYGASDWKGQTFTTSSAYTIYSVKLKLYRYGNPGTITVALRNTSSDLPTGSNLISGTTNGNTLTTDPAGELREIVFSSTLALSSSTKYAIIVNAASGDINNQLTVLVDSTTSAYAGGDFIWGDGATTWNRNTNVDCMFEVWNFGFTYPPTPTDGTQVYFDTGTSVTVQSTEIDKEITSNSVDMVSLYNGNKTRAGQRISDFSANYYIYQISFTLKRTNNPSGTASITVRDSNTDALIGTIGTINVATISDTDPTWYNFTGSVQPTVTDIRILVEYSGGDGANCITIYGSSSNVGDGVYTAYQGSWTDVSSFESAFKLYYRSNSYAPLSPSTTYYFSAWAYDSDSSSYSATYAQLSQATSAGVTPDISIDDNTHNYGIVATSSETGTGLTHFTITNNSGFSVDLTIGGTNMTGGVGWTLSDTATIGENIFGLKAGLSGGDYTIIIKRTAPYNTLKAGLGNGSTQAFGIKLYAPSSVTDGVQKTGTVTVYAAAS